MEQPVDQATLETRRCRPRHMSPSHPYAGRTVPTRAPGAGHSHTVTRALPKTPSTRAEAIGYLRVSTQEQGRSGLGLAAQRAHIDTFAAQEGFAIQHWYQDIQTGAGKDALRLRPGLANALEAARLGRCPLIVSRLDRLSRN